jgi:hypothetical protein
MPKTTSDTANPVPVLEYSIRGGTVRAYVLSPGERFPRFGGSSAGLLVRKTASLIVSRVQNGCQRDDEYAANDRAVWDALKAEMIASLAQAEENNMNGVRVDRREGGTIIIPLPRILWRESAFHGHECTCGKCDGSGMWDAIAVHPEKRHTWTCHVPELQPGK